MTEKTYDPKAFALSLGFSEDDAIRLASNNTNATNIRRIAKNRGYPAVAEKAEPKSETTTLKVGELLPKPHKHSYRKDGTCACGQVRRAKKASK